MPLAEFSILLTFSLYLEPSGDGLLLVIKDDPLCPVLDLWGEEEGVPLNLPLLPPGEGVRFFIIFK